ncbi:polysaccharide biosynthesis C-terminal domain-containing protein [Geomonas oryzisoli]|uniref:Polysaccharide biosynthesis C-terminal domain-containing protein n=1 Tax=Geomonas oryzisoli TaxID=2847992 RepID=A0ABX8JH28_9BACT|nr:polysaccharide biosynthesis C-terminal domain-containing protein [Geomonas oryzisoli]QWV94800.1 polysaccharide biosynthesis C-terminal domain-containing protein [Geomonas oryzisoli]
MRKVRTVLLYGGASALGSLITFVTTTVLTRLTSAEVFGRYAIMLSTALVLSSVASEWVKQSIGRMLPGAGEREASAVVAAAVVFLAVVAGAGAVVAPVSMLFDAGGGTAAVAAFTSGQAVFGVASALLQAGAVASVLSCALVFAAAAKLAGGVIALLLCGAAASGLLGGSAAGLWFTSAAMLVFILRKWSVDWSAREETVRVLRQMVNYGTPFIFWYLLSQVLNVGDRYVLRYFAGDSVVGLYSAGYSIAYGLVAMLTLPVSMATSPRMMAAWNAGDRKGAVKQSLRISLMTFAACSAVVLALVLFADTASGLFLGAKFQGSQSIMWIVAIGAGLWQTSIFWHKIYEYTNRTWVMVAFLLIAAVTNIGFDVLVVPSYGMAGAAWGTVAGYGVYAALNFVAVMASLRSRTWA